MNDTRTNEDLQRDASKSDTRGASGRRWTVALAVAALVVGIATGERVKSALGTAWQAVFSGSGEGSGEGHGGHGHGNETQYYTCGMHPSVVLPEPGDCPICHMKLTPLDPDKFAGEITIDPLVTQNIGVRIAPVESGPLERTLRTVGTVAWDETRVRDVNLKVDGWIEKLYVDYLGAPVAAGEPLLELYSPALYAAQEEYLVAYRRGGPGSALLEAARTRLAYFDQGPEAISALEQRGAPAKTATVTSPFSGVVLAKHANEGMKVTPGMQVFRIADPARVWVMVTLYEYQLPYVSVGQEAVVTLPYVPGQEMTGRVAYVYPTLDARTREVRARVELDNPGLLLKPGMYADVELRARLARERVLVPREAVIDTGVRQTAFVSLGEGRFEPRQVRLGVEDGAGRVEVLDGLAPGEMVVTSGQFLLDSEARIREGLARMLRGEMASDQAAVVAVAGVSELKELPPAAAAAIGHLLEANFEVVAAMAADGTDGVEDAARRMAAAVDELLAVPLPAPTGGGEREGAGGKSGDADFWSRHDEAATVRGAALKLVGVVKGDGDDALADARVVFSDLSAALATLLAATGIPPAYGHEVQRLHCPMYREDQGGTVWVQKAGPVRNPFYGSQMLECFDERHTLPVTGAEATAQAPPKGAEQAPPTGADAGAPERVGSLPPRAAAALTDSLDAYLEMSATLAADSQDGVTAAAGRLAGALDALFAEPPPAAPHLWHRRPEPEAMKAAAAALTKEQPIADARNTFSDLSTALEALLELTGAPSDYPHELRRYHCHMYRVDDGGAVWIQKAGPARNPFWGSRMLECYDWEKPVRVSGAAPADASGKRGQEGAP